MRLCINAPYLTQCLSNLIKVTRGVLSCKHSGLSVCRPAYCLEGQLCSEHASMTGVCLQDVVYFFAPKEDAKITISLCSSSAFSDTFDTKLYVLADLLAPRGGQVFPVACNDDFCGHQSQITVSDAPAFLLPEA